MSYRKEKNIFGPVDSRRLGCSLGINLVPYKTCSMDCIYCECGSTTLLGNTRKSFYSAEEILQELDEVLGEREKKRGGDHGLDFLTFSGLGEPTLNRNFGRIVAALREKYPQLKICLLTNASCFSDPQVRREAAMVHLVIPSLDGSNAEEFQKINRPAKEVTFEKVVQGIMDFRRETKGKVEMYVEIFLVPGINDSPEAAERFKVLMQKIAPDRVQLNSLDRVGVLASLAKVPDETLEMFASLLAPVVKVEIPSRIKRTQEMRLAKVEYEILECFREEKILDMERLCTLIALPETECVRHLRNLRQCGFVREMEEANGCFMLTDDAVEFLQKKK